MHDDLTAQDIAMMQKELDHRKLELMPELIEEVKRTRAFGDLSENFEYKAAKQAQNRNRSRIRYLERMIKSAHVIEDKAGADEVGLFDKVELLFEDDEDTETVQVVTTVRCDPLSGRISCKAPLGKALLGRKAGDEVSVTIHEGRNRQIRRMCEKAGLGVRRLKRVAIGNMPLDPKLKSGAWRELTQDELAYLQDLCAGIEE